MKMKSLLKAIVVSILFLSSFTYAATSDIVGNYHCKGYDPYAKKNYDSALMIKKTGETFGFEWQYSTNEIFKGTGVRNKDDVAAIFWSPTDAKFAGVIVFEIKDKKWQGTWSVKETEVTGSETCEKNSENQSL